MGENFELERDLEETYLMFALRCFENTKGLSLEDFYRLENKLYEDFIRGVSSRSA